ncbi:MAG: hypothetical protein DMG32_14595 [Acidobacteria bacterium]|nr:MAG: hypothetical protein DMG32_14595 [Acidobacteriota bacterium]
MTRLLYILPGLVPPDPNVERDKFTYLSKIAEGEILLPVWWNSPKKASPFLQETFPIYRVGKFRYHLFLFHRFPIGFRRLAAFLFYIRRGLQLHRERKFDVIVAYGTNRPGIAGALLKWITGAKLIVEVPGVPEDAFRYDAPNARFRAGVRHFFADQLLLIVGRMADSVKLLYPSQLRKYPRLQAIKAAVFHDFVPVRTIDTLDADEPFILLVGYPWYTKGVDVLIRAFKSIADQFPNYKLKLLGYYPDRADLNTLAASCPQIEFVPAGPAYEAIGACSIYVLASRTESMGRVLLEAMAARKPIIASAVGGVPYYIANNINGLLFHSENIGELARNLVTLLSSQSLRNRLSQKGYERVTAEFDERAYVRSFRRMLHALKDDSCGSTTGGTIADCVTDILK